MDKLKYRTAQHANIAELVQEAYDTLKRMPDRERALLMQAERGQVWPLMVHTADEHAAWTPQPMRRPPPTAKQVDSMHLVLEWLLVLARSERKYFNAVWLFCALRKGPVEASKYLGCHRQSAVTWRDNGLDRIARHISVTSPESIALRDSLMQAIHHPQRKAG